MILDIVLDFFAIITCIVIFLNIFIFNEGELEKNNVLRYFGLALAEKVFKNMPDQEISGLFVIYIICWQYTIKENLRKMYVT